jgi:hypothetical protein
MGNLVSIKLPDNLINEDLKFVEFYSTSLKSFLHKIFHGNYYHILHYAYFPLTICLKCSHKNKDKRVRNHE